ncbi:hypothetical protein ACS0TY_001597 [Phlomoides rotata]
MAFGFKVMVLEGRKRAGGRLYTKKLEGSNRTATVDLGGSVLTGTFGNPLGILARQLSSTLHTVRDKCPLYRVDGTPMDPDLDRKVEASFNQFLDKLSKTRQLMVEVSQDVSLGAALDTFWEAFNEEEMKMYDPYDMGEDHCFLPGGNGRLVQVLVENVPIQYEKTVQTIRYGSDGMQFIPKLPQRKLDAIRRLGFGLLIKVALLFPHAFWGTDLDTFGHLCDHSSSRDEFFLFYSYATVAGGPLLIALVAGETAYRFEKVDPTDSVRRVLRILREQYMNNSLQLLRMVMDEMHWISCSETFLGALILRLKSAFRLANQCNSGVNAYGSQNCVV